MEAVNNAVDGATNAGKSVVGTAWKATKIAGFAYGALTLYGAFATGGTTAFAGLASNSILGLNEATADLTAALEWGTESINGLVAEP